MGLPLLNELLEVPELLIPGYKPFGDVELVNDGNFLNRWLFRHIDDVTDYGTTPFTLTKAGTITRFCTPKGVGVKFGGASTDYYTTGGMAAAPDPWMVEILFQLNSTGTQLIMTMAENPNSGTADKRIYVDSSGNIGAQLYDGADKEASWGAATTGKFYHAIFGTDGTDFHLTMNGVPTTTVSVNNIGYTGYTSPEWVIGSGRSFGEGSGEQPSDCTLLFANIYGRYIPPGEAAQLTRSPLTHLYRPANPTAFIPEHIAVGAQTAALLTALDCTDAFAAVVTAAASITENINYTDTESATAAASASIVEALSAGDSDGGSAAALAALTDNTNLTDTESALAAAIAALNAGLNAGETWAADAVALADLTAAMDLGDAYVAAVSGALTGALTAGTSNSEAFVAAASALANLTEGVDLDDTMVATTVASASIAASISFGASFDYGDLLGCLVATLTLTAALSASTKIDTAVDGDPTMDAAVDGDITICPQ